MTIDKLERIGRLVANLREKVDWLQSETGGWMNVGYAEHQRSSKTGLRRLEKALRHSLNFENAFSCDQNQRLDANPEFNIDDELFDFFTKALAGFECIIYSLAIALSLANPENVRIDLSNAERGALTPTLISPKRLQKALSESKSAHSTSIILHGVISSNEFETLSHWRNVFLHRGTSYVLQMYAHPSAFQTLEKKKSAALITREETLELENMYKREGRMVMTSADSVELILQSQTTNTLLLWALESLEHILSEALVCFDESRPPINYEERELLMSLLEELITSEVS